jgi:predicted enzyme related to lactoylglutathione lyase
MGEEKIAVGEIIWRDLTVEDAPAVRDFYVRLRQTGEVVAGICHARGENADLPPVWLLYVRVADVDASVERCLALGGKVLDGPRAVGSSRFCAIQDPAGARIAQISWKFRGQTTQSGLRIPAAPAMPGVRAIAPGAGQSVPLKQGQQVSVELVSVPVLVRHIVTP